MKYWLEKYDTLSDAQQALIDRANEGCRVHTFEVVQRGVLSDPDFIVLYEQY
jgi:hypothetical protein